MKLVQDNPPSSSFVDDKCTHCFQDSHFCHGNKCYGVKVSFNLKDLSAVLYVSNLKDPTVSTVNMQQLQN